MDVLNPSESTISELAEILFKLKRYSEVIETIGELVPTNNLLDPGCRVLFCSSYKKIVSELRKSLDSIITDMNLPDNKNNTQKYLRLNGIRTQLLKQIDARCVDFIKVADAQLLKTEGTETFHWVKSKADFLRYRCENKPDDEIETFIPACTDLYHTAISLAEQYFEQTSPETLGVKLNFATFTSDILKDNSKAVEILQEAVDPAVDTFYQTPKHPNSTVLMQLILNNIALWKSTLPPILTPMAPETEPEKSREGYEEEDLEME